MKNKKLILLSVFIIILLLLFLLRPKSNTSISPFINEKEIGLTPSIEELPKDLEYSQSLTELHQKYPWYSKLPIETKDYRIIFDFDKNSFRIRLLTQSSEQIKQSALEKLNSIGVDLNLYSYYFLDELLPINPEL